MLSAKPDSKNIGMKEICGSFLILLRIFSPEPLFSSFLQLLLS